MAMLVREIEDWLIGLPEDAEVGIDDGGLCLRVVGDEAQYCDIGGIPRERIYRCPNGAEHDEVASLAEPGYCSVCGVEKEWL